MYNVFLQTTQSASLFVDTLSNISAFTQQSPKRNKKNKLLTVSMPKYVIMTPLCLCRDSLYCGTLRSSCLIAW